MRRVIIFFALLITLLTLYELNQQALRWHYVVPAEAGELLYATGFEGPLADWDVEERSTYFSRIQDGVLRVQVNNDDQRPFAAAGPYLADFDLTVDVDVVSGDFSEANLNAYGVVFRLLDERNYYLFLVSGDGYYRVQRVRGGTEIDLSTWYKSDAIKQGTDVQNRLRVEGHGDRFRFYINDTLLPLCIPDSPDAQSTIVIQPGREDICLQGTWTNTLIDDSHSFGRLAVAVFGDSALSDNPLIVDFDNLIVYSSAPFDQDNETTQETGAG